MHPEFSQMAIHDHQRELDRRTRAAFAGQAPEPAAEEQEAARAPALHRRRRRCARAPRDARERPAPAGRYVVAEVDGEVVAAYRWSRAP